MTSFNLGLLTKQEQDDIALEKHAAMLIRQVKNGQITKQAVKSELDRELNSEVHARFKGYLNKYRLMK